MREYKFESCVTDMDKRIETRLSPRAKAQIAEVQRRYPPEKFEYKFTYTEPCYLALDLTPKNLPPQPKLVGIKLMATMEPPKEEDYG